MFVLIRALEVNAPLSAMREIRYQSSLTWAEMKAKVDGFEPNRLLLRPGIQSTYSREARLTVIGIQTSLNLRRSTDGLGLAGRFSPAFGEHFITVVLAVLATAALFAPSVTINGENATWPMRLTAFGASLTVLGLLRFYLRRERERFIRDAEAFLCLERIPEAEQRA